MQTEELTDLILEAETLKWVPRAGWALRGVANAESVAEHSFGVAFICLALCDALQKVDHGRQTLDREKVLVMALVHDLAEVRVTDLPASASRLIPPAVKSDAERTAIHDLLGSLAGGGQVVSLWQEFEGRSSPEGRLVRDADKLEMMVQCLRYEQAGSRGLDEFWMAMDQREWNYRLCSEIYARLKTIRGTGL